MSTPRPPALPLAAALLGAGLMTLLPLPAQAQVNPAEMVDAFEAAGGKFAGFRRSGAKGVCARGDFVGAADARALSTAGVFDGRPVPVLARFSIGGGNPKAPENVRGVRGLALQFDGPGGEVWQMANISTPVFGAATPEQMLAGLNARRPDPATGKPDPDKVKAFTDANPESTLQGKYLASQPVPASFAGVRYWGVNAFGFVDAAGRTQYGKWVFEPVGGLLSLTDDEAKARPAEFLVDDLRQRVAAAPVAFDFKLQLAEPGDRIDSAVTPLPEGRRTVTLGRLTIRQVQADAGGDCQSITFNPIALPRGVVASADPILLGRAAPYATSLARRLQEGVK